MTSLLALVARYAPACTKRPFGVVALLYLLAGVALFSRYRQLLNPDATAYLGIAERYAEGDIAEAVNAYWPPLLSWLLAPAVFLADPIVAAKGLLVLSGLAALGSCWLLLGRLSVRFWYRFGVCVSLIPLILWYAYSNVTPDLLAAALLLFLLWLVSAPNRNTWRLTFASGIVGGLAFLAKGAPVLPLVAVTLAAAAFLHPPAERRWSHVTVSLGVLVAIALPWIVAISIDEGAPTLSTASAYNWYLASPDAEGRHPMTTLGLLPPAHATAVSAWEDPGQIHVTRWTPIDDPVYGAKRFLRNLARYAVQVVLSLPLAGVIAPLALTLTSGRCRRLGWFLAAFAALLAAAYSPLFYLERYAFTSFLLVAVLAGRAVEGLRGRGIVGCRAALALVLIVGLTNAGPAVLKLALLNTERAADEQAAARLLRANGGVHVAASGEWNSSLHISYRAGARFFGVARPEQSTASLKEDLDRHAINAFLLWGEPDERPPYLADFTQVGTLLVHDDRATLYRRGAAVPHSG